MRCLLQRAKVRPRPFGFWTAWRDGPSGQRAGGRIYTELHASSEASGLRSRCFSVLQCLRASVPLLRRESLPRPCHVTPGRVGLAGCQPVYAMQKCDK